jgi:four helix bundle protein
MARSYRELLVWQKAKSLAVNVFRATESFPQSQLYGLTSQLRRAAVSVASNIAEGQGRLITGEFRHFLGQARGSLLEMETQLAIALDLDFLNRATFDALDKQSYQVLGLTDRLLNSLRQTKQAS